LNAQALGISGPIAGILKRARGKHTMWLSVMRRRSSWVWKISGLCSTHVEEEDSYYSEHSDNEEELKEAYMTLYIEYEKLRKGRKQHLNDLNSLLTKKSSLLLKVQELEEKLLETQL
jgi:hypothetical protein